ncbi:MAG TPA: hypothetical protein VFN67_38685 [Polyangiales bacterium]|jgi:hypothetical protein|nr:hypothetical protein [Polyangiales bacterium]
MASDTKKTEMRRRKKRATNGRDASKRRARAGTPKFPINPEATANTSK